MTANLDKRLSAAGERFTASFEGVVLHPYNDPANATIGIGHLIHLGPVTNADIARYRGFTYNDALALLALDVRGAEMAIREAITRELNQHEWDAVVDLVFNCGPGVLRGTIGQLLNAGDIAGAAQAWQAWCHGNGGVVLPGLVRRRQAERELALQPERPDHPAYQPPSERKMIREHDHVVGLLAVATPTHRAGLRVRLAVLRRRMRARMNLIAKLAKETGWDVRDRSWRYRQLKQRTT